MCVVAPRHRLKPVLQLFFQSTARLTMHLSVQNIASPNSCAAFLISRNMLGSRDVVCLHLYIYQKHSYNFDRCSLSSNLSKYQYSSLFGPSKYRGPQPMSFFLEPAGYNLLCALLHNFICIHLFVSLIFHQTAEM